MKLKTVWSYLSAACLFLPPLAGCAPTAGPFVRTLDGPLGTVTTATIYDSLSADEAEQAFDALYERLMEIHDTMTAFTAGSDIARVGEASGVSPAEVSGDTFAVIQTAQEVSVLSGGAFDITIGPLVRLWDIGAPNAHVPLEEEIQAARLLVDYRTLVMDDARQSVFLPVSGQRLDLGGIAKGHAGDEAARILEAHGIEHAIVDLGGNIILRGGKPDGGPWRVGLKTPVAGETGYLGILSLSDGAVVTSGGYQRFFEEDGITYHHILDPRTGRPAAAGLLSVTVVCQSSTRADALSTACFVLGLSGGKALIEGLDGAEGIFVTEEKQVYLTPGLVGLFSLTDERYTWGAAR